MEDILTLRVVLAIVAASASIGALFGALLFVSTNMPGDNL
jgi:hypothetical protein